jgi:hypothetical protein
MKLLIRNTLLGAAGLVALSLPAHALGSVTLADTPQFVSKTTQLGGSRTYTDDGYGRMRVAGSVGFKKLKKKAAKGK